MADVEPVAPVEGNGDDDSLKLVDAVEEWEYHVMYHHAFPDQSDFFCWHWYPCNQNQNEGHSYVWKKFFDGKARDQAPMLSYPCKFTRSGYTTAKYVLDSAKYLGIRKQRFVADWFVKPNHVFSGFFWCMIFLLLYLSIPKKTCIESLYNLH